MNPMDLYLKYEHISKETLYKVYKNPRLTAKQYRIDYEDLLQYAKTGLWIAATTYNPEKSKFITHAINHIKWHVNTKLIRECNVFKVNPNSSEWKDNMYKVVSMDAQLDTISDEEYKEYHDIVASDSDVVNDVESNIASEHILNALDDKQIEILKLRDKGMSYREIGELWNMTGANVKAKIYKARKQLENIYGEVVGA